MSAVRHLALGVDITLLKTHLAVVTEAVGALRLPKNCNKLPHTVSLVLCNSTLSVLMSQHIHPYVIVLPDGTKHFLINTIVFVPFISLMPCASCPISLTKECIQRVLSGPFRRCLYSLATPVSECITEFASIVVRISVTSAYCGAVPPENLEQRFVLGLSATVGDGEVFTLGSDGGLSGGMMWVSVCIL